MTEKSQGRPLYINTDTRFAYRYAREYGVLPRACDDTIDAAETEEETTIELGLVSRDGETRTVRVANVPDGVSLDANVAIVSSPRMSRLYVYSELPLDRDELETLDRGLTETAVKRYVPYPILHPAKSVARLESPNRPPRNNFYVPLDDPICSSAGRFVEYRYFLDRHRAANVAFEPATGRVYRLAPPYPTPVVLIMPANFVRTGPRRGYFVERGGGGDDVTGLIVRVYSRRALSADDHVDVGAQQLVSVLPSAASEERVLTHARSLLARLGMHRVIVNRDSDGDLVQIYAYDEYATLVIGRADNLQLP